MIKIKITAAKNSGNETVFNIIDQDNNPVDLTALGATLVTVSVCGVGCTSAEINSGGDDVSFAGDVVRVKFGKLNLPVSRGSQVYLPKLSYITLVDSDPEIIAGEGFNTQIELKVVC